MSDPADQATSGTNPQAPWAPPAAPPFGPPPGYPAQGAYAPPPGYTGPYAARAAPVAPGQGARGPRLGIVALVAALGAAVLAPLVAGIAAFNVGLGTGRDIASEPIGTDFDWSMLTPVRDWVLLAEVSFWVGTVLGVWAIVQGIVATVARRGRGAAIAAIVIAVIGPFVFALVLWVFLAAGYAAGSGVGG